jgi:uncharacterized membrane protein (UPF0127 family)
MKYLRLVVVGALIGLGISTFIKVYSSVPKACNVPYRHDTTISIGSNSISTEVAKTDDQKDKGLGGRDCIGTDQGMLFIFDKPATYPFWMKDMKSNVSPASYPETFQNSAPAQYVLELKAGQAKALEINNKTNLSFDLPN